MVKFQLGADIPDTAPNIPLPLKWVGISGLRSPVTFLPIFSTDPNYVQFDCIFDLFSTLNKNKKGVHLSRFSEALLHLFESEPKNIYEFCETLAQKIVKLQGEDWGKVVLRFEPVLKKRTAVTDMPTLVPLGIELVTKANKSYVDFTSTLMVYIITTCPCGQEMSKAVAKDINSNPKSNNCQNNLQQDFAGICSHSQRAKLFLSVNHLKAINLQQLLDIAEQIKPILGTTLKRPDEFKLIQDSHIMPMFCEDIVRKALDKMMNLFVSLDSKVIVKASVVSEESIHPFSVYAFGEVPNMADLKNSFSSEITCRED